MIKQNEFADYSVLNERNTRPKRHVKLHLSCNTLSLINLKQKQFLPHTSVTVSKMLEKF